MLVNEVHDRSEVHDRTSAVTRIPRQRCVRSPASPAGWLSLPCGRLRRRNCPRNATYPTPSSACRHAGRRAARGRFASHRETLHATVAPGTSVHVSPIPRPVWESLPAIMRLPAACATQNAVRFCEGNRVPLITSSASTHGSIEANMRRRQWTVNAGGDVVERGVDALTSCRYGSNCRTSPRSRWISEC